MLNMEPNFLKIYLASPSDFMLEIYLEQAFSFDICKCCSDLLVSEILKMSSPNFSLGMLISFMLVKKESVRNVKNDN